MRASPNSKWQKRAGRGFQLQPRRALARRSFFAIISSLNAVPKARRPPRRALDPTTHSILQFAISITRANRSTSSPRISRRPERDPRICAGDSLPSNVPIHLASARGMSRPIDSSFTLMKYCFALNIANQVGLPGVAKFTLSAVLCVIKRECSYIFKLPRDLSCPFTRLVVPKLAPRSLTT